MVFLNPVVLSGLLNIVLRGDIVHKIVLNGTIAFPLVNVMLWFISLASGLFLMAFIVFPEKIMTHLEINWKNYILLGSTFGLCLIFTETALHFVDIRQKIQEYNVDAYEFHYSVSLNSDLFRDSEFVKDELEGKTKVFLIGDSFVFGAGVSQDETIDSFIEKKSDYTLDVYNLGREEAGLRDYYKIGEKFKDYHPDIVILSFYVDNDIMEEGLPDILRSSKLLSLISTVSFDKTCSFPWVRKYHISQAYIDLACNAEINPWLLTRASVGDNQTYYDERARIFREQSLSKETILSIRDLFPGSRFILLINPSKYQVNISYFDKMEELGFVFGEYPVDNGIQKEIISFCEDENIEYIDVLPHFISREDSGGLYYVIDDHYTTRANEFVAELIVSYLN